MKKKNTIFCDIDGTIFKYRKFETYKKSEAVPTLNTVKILQRWRDNGHMIVLTTARPENLRKHTLDELKNNNIPFDRLIMEIERGPRFLIKNFIPLACTNILLCYNVPCATLAQMVEHLTCNEDVVSSILTGGSILISKIW